MRIKIDENLATAHKVFLAQAGHEVADVHEEGVAGASDATLWQHVCAEQRFFVTLDHDFSDVRRFPPGSHPGILLVRTAHPGRELLARSSAGSWASDRSTAWLAAWSWPMRPERGSGEGEPRSAWTIRTTRAADSADRIIGARPATVRRRGAMRTKSLIDRRRPTPRVRTVQKAASELAPPTPHDMGRLRAAMEGDVDTTEIPEGRPGRGTRARRTPEGKPVAPPKSAIRDAIRRELGRRQITRYELWKRARTYCPTLPESAVYEFLRGERQIGLEYVEALLAAVELEVRRRHEARRDAH